WNDFFVNYREEMINGLELLFRISEIRIDQKNLVLCPDAFEFVKMIEVGLTSDLESELKDLVPYKDTHWVYRKMLFQMIRDNYENKILLYSGFFGEIGANLERILGGRRTKLRLTYKQIEKAVRAQQKLTYKPPWDDEELFVDHFREVIRENYYLWIEELEGLSFFLNFFHEIIQKDRLTSFKDFWSHKITNFSLIEAAFEYFERIRPYFRELQNRIDATAIGYSDQLNKISKNAQFVIISSAKNMKRIKKHTFKFDNKTINISKILIMTPAALIFYFLFSSDFPKERTKLLYKHLKKVNSSDKLPKELHHDFIKFSYDFLKNFLKIQNNNSEALDYSNMKKTYNKLKEVAKDEESFLRQQKEVSDTKQQEEDSKRSN
ncbi:MAG: hypothetical protein ACFFDN_39950, partial [Candidatus Hodarchaeota archaeon]